MKQHIKILFVLKKRNYDNGVSYGLKNSCQFVADALSQYKIESKIVEVVDGNGIDKEVFNYDPTHVFLEAIWCPPDKVAQLLKIYPKIKWFVRVHSKVEFLAHEGMAFKWLKDYAKISNSFNNFKLCFNNQQTVEDLSNSLGIYSEYAPNIYLFDKVKHYPSYSSVINIGCFGAIREFKNHINQALAALEFGNKRNLTVKFHINTSRFEKGGENILKNLRNLFCHTKHELVEHYWMNHEDFIKLVKTMDLGMQVSFTESFNIVAADIVSNNIPLVGSSEIEWLNSWYQAEPTDVTQIADKLEFAYYAAFLNLQRLNEIGLNRHNKESIKDWFELLDVR